MCGSSSTKFESSNSVENLFEAELSTWIFEKSLKNNFFIQNIPSNTAMKCFEYLSISETFSTFFSKNAHKYPSNGDRLDTDPWSIKGKK